MSSVASEREVAMNNYGPINPKFPYIWHGADYNPDQWRDTPEIWDEDMRLMTEAGCNTASVGIFSWTALEPEEGRYDFGWLDTIMDMLAQDGKFAVLATPSGARPAWLAQKYPEVLRVDSQGIKAKYGQRHNHCLTSPVYREKVREINGKLAERYQNHPALAAWHISNEYRGECHCELCQEAFREWLKKKYDHDLDRLNHAWWTGFWSHTYTDWAQIEAPSPIGDTSIHGLILDWKRFVTDQTVSFMQNEVEPLRRFTPDVPVTSNFMGLYTGLNYWKFTDVLDVASWDNYPAWHETGKETWRLAAETGFVHDIYRCLKGGKPFMMMESTPSLVNWRETNKLKRPGMHMLSSLQAVAHGADTVQYFQWRKGRGGVEKFHGAVVDHNGAEETRVFRDVAELGTLLKKLDSVAGTSVKPEVALVYDWENRWAIEGIQGWSGKAKDYFAACMKHYTEFWKRGISVDIIQMDCSFDGYKVVIVPMLYMIRPGVDGRLKEFVKRGGVVIGTYCTGVVDENDLCFLKGAPQKLQDLFGIWTEEVDCLYEGEHNRLKIRMFGKEAAEYRIDTICELIHERGAEVLGTYMNDFYAGMPAVTVNRYGDGKAYYIAADTEEAFMEDFYEGLIGGENISKNLDIHIPSGVTVQYRGDEKNDFYFLMNFNETECSVNLGNVQYTDMTGGAAVSGELLLKPYAVHVLRK